MTAWIKSSHSGAECCVELAPAWTKAQASIGTGACAELLPDHGDVLIRDSKNPDGPVLRFTRAEFTAFLDGAKNGEFDHLVAEEAA